MLRRLEFVVMVALCTATSASGAAAQDDASQAAVSSADEKRQSEIRTRQRLIAHQKRVDEVADRLISSLPPRARPDSVPYLGLRVADHRSGENALLAAAVGLEAPERPFVYSVDPSGPAGEAGLQPGDLLLAVGDDAIEDSKAFYKRASRRDLRFPLRVEALRDGELVEFMLAEAWRPRGLEVVARGDGKKFYAYADERQITVSSGMLNFLETDSELAVVLGHEIGHLVRGHFSSSYLEGGFQPYFSQGLEVEADRFGLELAHRAGYDPKAAAALWERFETELPRTIGDQWLLSHPPGRQRIASARRVAQELEAASAPRAASGP